VPLNIELKVVCDQEQITRIETRLLERNVDSIETLHQTDTYFRVAHGRLKVRRTCGDTDHSAELIHYQRPDHNGDRVSDYLRVPIAVEQAEGLCRALSTALGELATVRKQRRVAIWASTRIHLDEVDRLGSFIELETIVGNRTEADARAEFENAVEWLGLAGLRAICGSYNDLMMERQEH
jgi:predicted adenylyl cyclase CyaB